MVAPAPAAPAPAAPAAAQAHPSGPRPSLVADIGGTNTRVALAEGLLIRAGSIRRFRNADYTGLAPILGAYLSDEGKPALAGCCVAAAGPVRDGEAHMTNLDWRIDGALLARATGAARVAILNDLQAQGHALGQLAPGALRPVLPGAPARPDATRLVIGLGTGFNAAPVHEAPGGRLVAPSECGHVTLPTRTPGDLALAAALSARPGFASVEDVLSGRGLERLYAFTAHGTSKPASEIMAGLADGSDPAAAETARRFIRFLGAVAGDLALIHLPYGGIHLCGGVARAFAPWLEEMGFAPAFTDKGRFSELMADFPVRVIEDDYAALTGCAAYLAQIS